MEEKNKIVILCGKDVKSLAEMDADYIIIYENRAEIGPEGLSVLSDEMMRNEGLTAVVAEGGFIQKFNSLVYGVASGKKIPVPAGAVGFSLETAKALSNARKFDPVSLVMEAAASGVKTHSLALDSKVRTKTSKLIPRWWSLFLSSHILKYIFSSCVAFAVDYVLLLLLNNLLGGIMPKISMEVAAFIAWITSSLTNFIINRNFVFRSGAPLLAALGEYYGLALVVFLLKTYVLLEVLTRVLSVPLGIAKPIAEVVFFVTNYFIQKKLIFKKKK